MKPIFRLWLERIARSLLLIILTFFFVHLFTSSPYGNLIEGNKELKSDFKMGRNDVLFYNHSYGYGPILLRTELLDNEPIIDIHSPIPLRVPFTNLKYLTCIYVANYYKEADGDLKFIKSGPVGLEAEIDDNKYIIEPVETEGNTEFCIASKSVSLKTLSIIRARQEIPDAHRGACREETSDCDIEIKTIISWKIDLQNKYLALSAIWLFAFTTSVLYATTILLLVYRFIFSTGKSNKSLELKKSKSKK